MAGSSAAHEGADERAAEDVGSDAKIWTTRTADPRRSTPLLPPAVLFGDWRNEIFARRPRKITTPAEEDEGSWPITQEPSSSSAGTVDVRFPFRSLFFLLFFRVGRSDRLGCLPLDPSHRRGCDVRLDWFVGNRVDLDAHRRGKACPPRTPRSRGRKGPGFQTVIAWGLAGHESTRSTLIGRGIEEDREERCDRNTLFPRPQRTSSAPGPSSSSWTAGEISFLGSFWVRSRRMRMDWYLPTVSFVVGLDGGVDGTDTCDLRHAVGWVGNDLGSIDRVGWGVGSLRSRLRMTHRISWR